MTATTPATTTHGSRLVGADGIRAFAALWVVFSHLFQRLALPVQEPWLQDVQVLMMKGAYGVSIFFVLSGMLLSHPFWTAYLTGGDRPHLGRYARRRFARIAPGFYASLAVSFVVSLSLVPDAPHRLWRLVSGLTFTSGFHYVTFFPVEGNGPLWSIGFEVVSYVLMPLAMLGLFALGRRGARSSGRGLVYWFAVLGAVVVVNQAVITAFTTPEEGKGWQYGLVGGAQVWMPAYNPVGFFGHFTVGVLAAALIATWQVHHGGVRRRRFDALAAGALVAAAALTWFVRYPPEPDNTTNFQGQPYLFPVFAGLVALVLVGLSHSTFLGRLVDNPFARYTAKVSFGIYVWHYLVLTLVSEATNGEFEYFGIVDPQRHLVLSAVVLAITYAVATLSWYALERPVLHSRWATRRPVVATVSLAPVEPVLEVAGGGAPPEPPVSVSRAD